MPLRSEAKAIQLLPPMGVLSVMGVVGWAVLVGVAGKGVGGFWVGNGAVADGSGGGVGRVGVAEGVRVGVAEGAARVLGRRTMRPVSSKPPSKMGTMTHSQGKRRGWALVGGGVTGTAGVGRVGAAAGTAGLEAGRERMVAVMGGVAGAG